MVIPPAEQKRRTDGIGGTKAAAIVGVSPWAGPLDVWRELTGQGEARADNEAMRWGRLLESVVREEYARQRGVCVYVPAESIVHPVDTWKHATPDGLVYLPPFGLEIVSTKPAGDPERGLEIKTAGAQMADEWGKPGTDDIPLPYLVQCAWYMHVCNLDRWDVAALIGGRDFRIYTIERDRELEDFLVAAVGHFYQNHVLAGTAPPATARSYREYLVQKWSKVAGEYVQADARAEELVRTILALRQDNETNDAEIEAREIELRELIADAPGLDTSIGRIHCKPVHRRIVEWETIARRLAVEIGLPQKLFAELVDGHTKDAKPSRPMRYPARKKASGWDGCGELAERGMAGLKARLRS